MPTNAPFEAPGELARVMGVTPALMSRIAGSLTVYSRQRGINPATAARDALANENQALKAEIKPRKTKHSGTKAGTGKRRRR